MKKPISTTLGSAIFWEVDGQPHREDGPAIEFDDNKTY